MNFDKIVNIGVGLLLLVGVAMYADRNYFNPPTQTKVSTPVYKDGWEELTQLGQTSNPKAEVQLVVFSDYECPFCKDFHDVTLPALVKDFNFGLTIIHYPLGNHQNARKAAMMAECARMQDRFTQMDSVLFANVKSLASDTVDFAKLALVPDTVAWNQCVKTDGAEEVIKRNLSFVGKYEIGGTPMIFVNGWQIGNGPADIFIKAVEDILQGKKPFKE